MSDMDFEYNSMRLPVSRQFIEETRAIDEAIQRESRRALEDMIWMMEDDKVNGHLGPRLGPGRKQLWQARQRLLQDEYFRSLGRPAGPYRRQSYFQDPIAVKYLVRPQDQRSSFLYPSLTGPFGSTR